MSVKVKHVRVQESVTLVAKELTSIGGTGNGKVNGLEMTLGNNGVNASCVNQLGERVTYLIPFGNIRFLELEESNEQQVSNEAPPQVSSLSTAKKRA